jgi:hypothetical protein
MKTFLQDKNLENRRRILTILLDNLKEEIVNECTNNSEIKLMILQLKTIEKEKLKIEKEKKLNEKTRLDKKISSFRELIKYKIIEKHYDYINEYVKLSKEYNINLKKQDYINLMKTLIKQYKLTIFYNIFEQDFKLFNFLIIYITPFVQNLNLINKDEYDTKYNKMFEEFLNNIKSYLPKLNLINNDQEYEQYNQMFEKFLNYFFKHCIEIKGINTPKIIEVISEQNINNILNKNPISLPEQIQGQMDILKILDEVIDISKKKIIDIETTEIVSIQIQKITSDAYCLLEEYPKKLYYIIRILESPKPKKLTDINEIKKILLTKYLEEFSILCIIILSNLKIEE